MGTTPNQSTSGTAIGNRMTHSLSTPSGVDGSSAPINRGGKKLAIRIQMLDDSVTMFQVQVNILLVGICWFEQTKICMNVLCYAILFIGFFL